MKNNVVYKIENTVDGKCYVGKTNSFERRAKQHFSALMRGNHANPLLQQAYNQYGRDAFEITIIENDIQDYLLERRERYWIQELKAKAVGYNAVRLEAKETDSQWKALQGINEDLLEIKRKLCMNCDDKERANLQRLEQKLTTARRMLRRLLK